MPRSPRGGLAGILARLLGRSERRPVRRSAGAPRPARTTPPRGHRASPQSAALADRSGQRDDAGASLAPTVTGSVRELLAPLRRTTPAHDAHGAGGAQDSGLTSPLTLERIEAMLTGPMGYAVQRRQEEGRLVLVGSWDDFPFVIEEPEEHEGWMLVSGDATQPLPLAERGEIGASVNDWNRDKFFPTVAVVDTPVGPVVRATYLVDLSDGVNDAQLRLHLGTALSACTQALSQVGPLLPGL
nr:YbjN domain-containing protein [Actinomyces sp.]